MPVLTAVSILISLFIIQVTDVARLRLRSRVLAMAVPGSPEAARAQPQASTPWSADSSVADDWSARNMGAWWMWRALMCLLPGCAVILIQWTYGGSITFFMLLIWFGIYDRWKALCLLKADLSNLEANSVTGQQGL